MPELSVVIPCRDGLPWLRDQLDALAGEDPGCEWEVILADNGSTDGSAEVARAYQGRLPIRVVDASAGPGPAYARNAGTSVSRGDVLVFLDQDDLISPGYLSTMRDEVHQWGFVAAIQDTVSLNPAWAAEAIRGQSGGRLVDGLWPFGASGTLAIRRDGFEQVGGFDPALPGAAEDPDFCWRVQRDTGLTLRQGQAVLHYRLRSAPAEMFRQRRLRGRADVDLYVKWASAGMPRPAPRAVAVQWSAAAKHLLLAWRSRSHRARGLWLLGANVGHLEGSIRRRRLYL